MMLVSASTAMAAGVNPSDDSGDLNVVIKAARLTVWRSPNARDAGRLSFAPKELRSLFLPALSVLSPRRNKR